MMQSTRIYLSLQRWLLQRCAAIIAVSEAVAADLVQVLRAPEERVHVVHEGVASCFTDHARPPDLPRGEHGPDSGPYALWVGSMRSYDARKCLDALVRGIARVQPRLSLVLAGATGEESARLAASARDLGLSLVLPGYVSDSRLADLYRGAAAVVFPSAEEGFGLPVIEALACGAPVVATATGFVRVLPPHSVVRLSTASPDAIAQEVTALLADPARASALRRLGPQVTRPYTWARAAELTEKVYFVARQVAPSDL